MRIVFLVMALGMLGGCASQSGNGVGIKGSGGNQGSVFSLGGSIRL